MTRLLPFAAVALALLAAGCKEGTSTAPASDPANPSKTRKLTLRTLVGHKVHRDGTDVIEVMIDRDGFDGPVAVELRNLPTGVSRVTEDTTIPAGKGSIKLTVKATPDAPLVKGHVVQVGAKAKDQADLPEAVTDFKLDVLEKQ